MESIDRSALVPYTQAEMFALVSDVDSYPEFLPWCSGAETLSCEEDHVDARIEFHVGGLKKSFTTRNRHVQDALIEMQLVDGPFSDLQGRWEFTPLGQDGCRISLHMEYDFSSRMVRSVTAPVFGQIANSLVDAFQKRAAEIYGER
ncbi:MAG: type II toxin-antitoxin system RatA family toxin [Thiohalobacterales bacterium]|nr:type II toxin-antitoxin system RatA family toxin [Thiohalobacterales bacterium]